MIPKMITIQVWPSDSVSGIWVGKCLEWDAMSQGRTEKEAFEATLGAVDMLRKHYKRKSVKTLQGEDQ